MKISLSVISLAVIFYVLGCKNATDNPNSKDQVGLAVEDVEKDYLSLGNAIADKAQAVLARNLLEVINNGGPVAAISFCSEKALTLTDSVALALEASVKRVTGKPRNPLNRAIENELSYINTLKSKGNNFRPMISEIDGKMVGYYPIVINALCLQCHGSISSDISSATFSKLSELYPKDQATEYKVNELRGLWVVNMNKE